MRSSYGRTTEPLPISGTVKKYRDDYIGMRFGNLTVTAYPTKNGVRMGGAYCLCDCGNEVYVDTISNLYNGKKYRCTQCGRKAQSEAHKLLWKTHPAFQSKYGDARHDRLFHVWSGMIQRGKSDYGCYSDVSVCDEWKDYFVFKEWAYSHGYDENAPFGKCTIDRINPFGNYEPSNCRFVDMKTQQKNKRSRWNRLEEETKQLILATAKA